MIKKKCKIIFVTVLITWKPNSISIRREVHLELGKEATNQMET